MYDSLYYSTIMTTRLKTEVPLHTVYSPRSCDILHLTDRHWTEKIKPNYDLAIFVFPQ